MFLEAISAGKTLEQLEKNDGLLVSEKGVSIVLSVPRKQILQVQSGEKEQWSLCSDNAALTLIMERMPL